MSNFCKKCGHALKVGAKFCPGCGTALYTQAVPKKKERVKTASGQKKIIVGIVALLVIACGVYAIGVFCQVKIPKMSVIIPFFRTGKFPVLSGSF